MSGQQLAIATLLYSAAYLPGVFTLGYQLKKLRGGKDVALLLLVSRDLYRDVLTELSLDILRKLFTDIIIVDPIQGTAGNNENLKLLNRPELHFTLVKARLWELNYDRVLYLDGDTLPLSTDVFNLFENYPINQNQIAGAPDVGWPDMFNSGVLLLAPDKELAQSLQKFISDTVSMDGADQGVLNQFFNAHCSRGIENIEQRWIRLPFVYNVTMPNYGYQSSPATKFFKKQIKLVHFIGENKPWKGWCGDEDSYSSQWNKVFLEFQSEYDLARYMKGLKLETSSSAWLESMTQSQQEPERVFPDQRTQQPVHITPIAPITSFTPTAPSAPTASTTSFTPTSPTISTTPTAPTTFTSPSTTLKKDRSIGIMSPEEPKPTPVSVERVFPEDSLEPEERAFPYDLRDWRSRFFSTKNEKNNH
ncbi:hypothetical protein ZYGR_0N01150 [Zygosaccharomyces rouxii]|uniref:ZYRO0D03080p n=2 Tax=Zygosaccharomyces rouxii TaxID=4956 RepID=C5DV14_ZYGRC|nr:uncharacterized protein ZYRO0D03080g [Zygosaccharomyces rouxii]KAH9200547.1 nucleotide-diphospho-sugar transferase [Zygosaccharomyces rouxii]GAV48711.1 hypothetical protein ZYGR_0N01150 [Zygosaccharomyces rouxii]CAR27633.1 ZYRO0D03080p [Zygosaccharomyces rouxii]